MCGIDEEDKQSYYPKPVSPEDNGQDNPHAPLRVCGGCADFKIIVNAPAADHDAWQAQQYAPEAEFLEKLKAVPGVKTVETQTFTMETL